MPSLKAKPDSGCAVETKVIGQYSPRHSDWHAQRGPKMRIFSVLASRCEPLAARILTHQVFLSTCWLKPVVRKSLRYMH